MGNITGAGKVLLPVSYQSPFFTEQKTLSNFDFTEKEKNRLRGNEARKAWGEGN